MSTKPEPCSDQLWILRIKHVGGKNNLGPAVIGLITHKDANSKTDGWWVTTGHGPFICWDFDRVRPLTVLEAVFYQPGDPYV